MFQVTEQLKEEQEGQVNEEMEESEEWLDMVVERSKRLLVQMASPDALIRLQCTELAEEERKKIATIYTEQHHGSISSFLTHCLHQQLNDVDEDGLLLHVRMITHSSLTYHSLITH